MAFSLIHVYHEDDNPQQLMVDVKVPLNNPLYCVEVLQFLDKVKSDTIKKLADYNNQKMAKKKGIMVTVKKLLSRGASEEQIKVADEQLKKMEEAEKIGQEIQYTMNNLARILNKVSLEDKAVMVKDINSAIERILGGC